ATRILIKAIEEADEKVAALAAEALGEFSSRISDNNYITESYFFDGCRTPNGEIWMKTDLMEDGRKVTKWQNQNTREIRNHPPNNCNNII
ncbi:hypothetical protein H4N54_12670, partial [Limnospira fusiformis KN01]